MNEKTPPPENIFYRKIISDNFTFIEKQCARAVQLRRKAYPFVHPVQLENEALELSNQVLDHLSKNDYQALRQFQHQSRLSTYLSAIIAKQAVDLIRKKRGRSREKERAEKYGVLGKQILQKIFLQGMSSKQVYDELKVSGNLEKSETEFEFIVNDIRGKRTHAGDMIELSDNPVVKSGIQNHETGEVILPDTSKNPEITVLKEIQGREIEEILKGIMKFLSGEEKLILRMKYPFQSGEEPEKIETISILLGISRKAVYKRIDRILLKCRSELKKRGIAFHDLF